jgi:hypothetical protein
MLEAAMMQHLPNGLAVGLAGYGYQQIDDDSGAGGREPAQRHRR